MITGEGKLTEGEVNDIKNMRNSELFRIVRKLCAHEYAKLAEMMTGDLSPEQMFLARGEMRGVKRIYGILLHNADLSYIDGKLIDANSQDGLQSPRKLRNVKE